MADSPSKNRDEVLSYTIYCDGNKVDDNYELISASVRLELNRIGKATLVFNAGDMERQSFDHTDSDLFKPGNTLRLDVGNINNENTVFEGIIMSIGIRAGSGNKSQMEIECRDYAWFATRGRKNQVFDKKKDSDIIKDVLSPYGNIAIDTTEFENPVMVQYYCTDWDFALSRAEINGLYIFTKGRDISVRKPKIDALPTLTVTYGVDMIRFDGNLSNEDQFCDYEAVSWNLAEQKHANASFSSPQLNKQGDLQPNALGTNAKMLLQTDAPIETETLEQWTKSMALKTGLARYRGSFSFYGSSEVTPGCIIELKGMGKRFNGDVFIGSVVHTIESNEWITEVGMGVSPSNITEEPDVVSPLAAGFLPGLDGIHTGIVKQLHDDPANEERILIELPWMNGEIKQIWARIAAPYAGNGFGFSFLPEKGDEVVVGFINADPCHPIILGSLHSSINKPGAEHTDENSIKTTITRSGLKIEFEEEKKIISISTPNQNQIEISDEGKSIKLSDQNKNEIELNGNGITLNSAKDIILKAKGNITLDAAEKASITAKADAQISGQNVKATASAEFTAKGTSKAELSASGQTVVKGAMVMIN